MGRCSEPPQARSTLDYSPRPLPSEHMTCRVRSQLTVWIETFVVKQEENKIYKRKLTTMLSPCANPSWRGRVIELCDEYIVVMLERHVLNVYCSCDSWHILMLCSL